MQDSTGSAGADHDVRALSDELRVAVWGLSRRMRVQVQEGADVPLGQQAVLALLDVTPGMTSAELARAEFVRPQSMNKTVAALREAGYVASTVPADDARRHELHLTTSGEHLLAQIRALRGDWLTERLERDLGADERMILAQAATIMRRLTTDEHR